MSQGHVCFRALLSGGTLVPLVPFPLHQHHTDHTWNFTTWKPQADGIVVISFSLRYCLGQGLNYRS